MRNDERRKQIVEIVMEEDSIRVSDLIERVDGSAATVRRDLTFLEQNGYILRKHGFVKYVQPEMVQSIEFSPEMIEIAKAAAKLVQDGDTIMLDSGFSTLALAYQLTSVNNLTVITNSIPVAALYNSIEHIQTYVTGGFLHIQTYVTGGFLRVRENALVGTDAIESIRKMHAVKVFISTSGIRQTSGLTCVSAFQEDVKRAFVNAADKVILLATDKKFEKDAVRVFATFDQIDTIITNKPIESKVLLQSLNMNNVEVIIA